MRQIVLADRYNTYEIIKEEKELWVSNLLIQLGVNPDELFEGNQEQLKKYDIQVWEHLGIGDVEIMQKNVLVGKWYAPELVAKCDENNNIYYEIHIDYNSIFDNEFNAAE